MQLAAELGNSMTSKLSKKEQKYFGQFITPSSIARFMAQRTVVGIDKESIHILEPAAGSGVLVSALVEALLAKDVPPIMIKITMFELDVRLHPTLKMVTSKLRAACKDKGILLKVSIKHGDFLLSKEAKSQKPFADVVIANPPYFKLNANDARAVAHPYALYGQPNIYGIFMAACSGLVKASGKWCFITPRSWTNGLYFSEVRRYILSHLSIDSVHVFDSRQDHFNADEILQETMITWATKQLPNNHQMIISSSDGSDDLGIARLHAVAQDTVIEAGDNRVITLHVNPNEAELNNYGNTLESLGLKVSTGPVVAFRAINFISESSVEGSVPLLWLQHIKTMSILWPINKKREHIVANADNAWMLVPNSPMVVLRRFSPKEDERRVTAAAYTRGLEGSVIGLENHLNYIYRPGGQMLTEEVVGLALYLNSRIVDNYFRAISGSTQVNATELRKLPLPSMQEIVNISQAYTEGMTLQQIDTIVELALGMHATNLFAVEA